MPFLRVAGAFLVALIAFGREEEAIGLSFQPGRDAQLGVAVTGGGVDVIDAVAQEDIQALIRDLLRHMT